MKRSLVVILLVTAATSICAAQSQPVTLGAGDGKYLRVVYEQQAPIALQTAVVRFASPKEQRFTVDLVGAVHYADRQYFESLNRRFSQYEAVLYELVAPEGQSRPVAVSDENSLWQLLQTALGLTSQLQMIDYTAGNFVHADMSPAEMQAAMESRGDNAITVALSSLADILRQANMQSRDAVGAAALFSNQPEAPAFFTKPYTPLELKRRVAVQFGQLADRGGSLGPTLDQLLVKDRNAAAMKVLQHEYASGKRKFAIFYGAGHMPDFARRLETQLGLVRCQTAWISAWDLSNESSVATSPLNVFLELLQSTEKG